MIRRRLLVALLGLLAGTAVAESPYEVLRSTGEGYAEVMPERAINFPQDHQPHPDYRIEWWYLTANLTDDRGQPWGVHWTLFRQSLAPGGPVEGWSSRQVWMAHAALSTPDGHVYEERFARGGIGQTGVDIDENDRFNAWMDDWQLTGTGPEPIPGTLRFTLGDRTLTLELNADTPWVLQGENGYAQKSDQGQASHYYSQPHIRTTGTLTAPNRTVNLSGKAWLDREWSSQPLAPDQPGWDWFSIHLDDGHALMVYQLRHNEGAPWLSGTWTTPDGNARPLTADKINLWVEERTEVAIGPDSTRSLPLTWTLAIPSLEQRWEIRALHPDHWLDTAFPYWEGPIEVTGTTPGVGYLELTGY